MRSDNNVMSNLQVSIEGLYRQELSICPSSLTLYLTLRPRETGQRYEVYKQCTPVLTVVKPVIFRGEDIIRGEEFPAAVSYLELQQAQANHPHPSALCCSDYRTVLRSQN